MNSSLISLGTNVTGTTAESRRPLEIDLLKLVDTRALVTASSGSGKSWLFRLLAERAAGKAQTLILDPEGEFGTLREKFDMLLVGEAGEIALDIRSARKLAHKLAELKVSAIFDLSTFDGWDNRREWAAEFLMGLMNVPKSLWHPIIILVDEAHMLAPESAGASRQTDPVTRSRQAIRALMSAGRKRGFAGVLASQRISKLDKDSLAEAKNNFIGGTVLDIDQQRAIDILGIPRAQRTVLRDMAPGEFYCFGPAFTERGVLRFYTDQVVTTHPAPGQRKAVAVPPASRAVEQIAEALADLPREVEHEADELKAAQQEISRLHRQVVDLTAQAAIKASKTIVNPQPRIERIEVPAFTPEQIAGLQELGRKIDAMVASCQAAGQQMSEQLGAFSESLARFKLPAAGRDFLAPLAPRAPANGSQPGQPAARNQPEGQGAQIQLRAGEKRILQELARLSPLRLTRSQLGTLAGFTPSGGTFLNYFGNLKRLGLLEESGDSVSITSEGLDYLGSAIPLPPRDLDEAMEIWRQKLPAGAFKMLDYLVSIYPRWVFREDLGRETGFTSSGGTFGNYLGLLKRNGLAELDNQSHSARAGAAAFLHER